MNIVIPSFIRDCPIEGTKVFLAFMLRLTNNDLPEKIRYYIDGRDVRSIMQRYMVNPTSVFGDYADHVRLGLCSDTHMFFEWKQIPIEKEIYTIEGQDLRQVWTYLLSRLQTGELVEDWNENGFPDRQPAFLKNEDDRALFSTGGFTTKADSERRLLKRQKRNLERANKPKRKVGRPKGSKTKGKE